MFKQEDFKKFVAWIIKNTTDTNNILEKNATKNLDTIKSMVFKWADSSFLNRSVEDI